MLVQDPPDLHGLPISGFLIPSSTFEVHALFVDTPIANARRLTHNAYGSEFSDEQKHDAGLAPLLLRDPNNPKRSIIDCTKGETQIRCRRSLSPSEGSVGRATAGLTR